jgi:hypothetical protein
MEDFLDEGLAATTALRAAEQEPHEQVVSLDRHASVVIDDGGNMTFYVDDDDDDDTRVIDEGRRTRDLRLLKHGDRDADGNDADVVIDEGEVFASPDPRDPSQAEVRALSMLPPEHRAALTRQLPWRQAAAEDDLDPFATELDDFALEHVPLAPVRLEAALDELAPEPTLLADEAAEALVFGVEDDVGQSHAAQRAVARRLRPARAPLLGDDLPESTIVMFDDDERLVATAEVEHQLPAKEVEPPELTLNEPTDLTDRNLMVVFEDDDEGAEVLGDTPGTTAALPSPRRRSTVTFSPTQVERDQLTSSGRLSAVAQALATARAQQAAGRPTTIRQHAPSPRVIVEAMSHRTGLPGARRPSSIPDKNGANPFVVPVDDVAGDEDEEDLELRNRNPLEVRPPPRQLDLSFPQAMALEPFEVRNLSREDAQASFALSTWKRRCTATKQQLALAAKSSPRITRFSQRFAVVALASAGSSLLLFYPLILQTCAQAIVCSSVDYGDRTVLLLRADRSVDCSSSAYFRLSGLAVACYLLYGVGGPFLILLATKRFVFRSLCDPLSDIPAQRRQNAVSAILACLFSSVDCSGMASSVGLNSSLALFLLPFFGTFGRVLVLSLSSQFVSSDERGLRRYSLYLPSVFLFLVLVRAARRVTTSSLYRAEAAASGATVLLSNVLVLLPLVRDYPKVATLCHVVVVSCLALAIAPFFVLAASSWFARFIEARRAKILQLFEATVEPFIVERRERSTREEVEALRQALETRHRRLFRLDSVLRSSRDDTALAIDHIRVMEDRMASEVHSAADAAFKLINASKKVTDDAEAFSRRLLAPAVRARAADIMRSVHIVNSAMKSYDASFRCSMQLVSNEIFIDSRKRGALRRPAESADDAAMPLVVLYLEQMYAAEREVLETTRILRHVLRRATGADRN